MANTVNEYVLNTVGYRNDAPPANLLEFRTWLNSMIDKIPVEHQGGALFLLDGFLSGSDDVPEVGFRIFYPRPETLEEAKARKQREAELDAAEEQKQLREYLRLRAKFGDKQGE